MYKNYFYSLVKLTKLNPKQLKILNFWHLYYTNVVYYSDFLLSAIIFSATDAGASLYFENSNVNIPLP